MICHFCFTVDVSSSVIGQSGSEDIKPASISTGQLLSNLVSVFNPLSNGSQDQANAKLTANGMFGIAVLIFTPRLLEVVGLTFEFW